MGFGRGLARARERLGAPFLARQVRAYHRRADRGESCPYAIPPKMAQWCRSYRRMRATPFKEREPQNRRDWAGPCPRAPGSSVSCPSGSRIPAPGGQGRVLSLRYSSENGPMVQVIQEDEGNTVQRKGTPKS